jgi:diguanylate cyclase (GGDEF)-like protein/PAS domain S-box-containing protein
MSDKGAILVVDDDSHPNLELLTDLLKAEGYEVFAADSGDLLLASVESNTPDLILLDISMPGLDGLNVLRRLKTQPVIQSIPVIFLSAVTDVEKREEGFKLGAVDFIAKPFQRGELLARVQTQLELSQLRHKIGEIEKNQEEERILLRTLIDNLPDVIYVKDIKGRKLISNIADWQACGGKKMEDVIGKTDFDTYPRELAESFWAVDKEVIESGIPTFSHEEPAINSHGYPIWILTSKVPLRDNKGQIIGLVGIGHDITQRKQVEEALLKSESSLNTILNSTTDGILAVGTENEVLFSNERFAEIWHIPQAVMKSKDDGAMLQFVIDQLIDPGGFLKKVQELYNSNDESFDALFFKDGRVFERLSRPLMQGDEVRGRVWSFRDITERSQTSKALLENEAKMSAIADSAHDAILMMDQKGRISYWNTAAESILGYSKTEAMGQNLHDWIVPQRYHEAHHAAFPAFVKTGQGSAIGKTHEVGAIRKDGTEIPVQLSLSSFQMDGEWYAVGIISDISERKNNELLQNVIYRITQATMTSGGIDALYQSIHSILGEYIPAKNFFIALYDPAKEIISFPYYIDQYDEKPHEPILIQGLTGYVIRTGRSLLATREIYDRLVQEGKIDLVGTAAVDWLGVPLKTDGRVIGVMAVQSYTEGIHFQQKDVDLLEFVSAQVSQVIERKRLEDEILSLSLTDELTGLYNRRGFMVLAEQEVKLAHRKKRNMLLFFGDVDKLKTINDTQGHAQGDLALKEVSIILKKIFREADIIARIGGDEFVALALDASQEGEKIMADRIQSAFEVRNHQGDMAFNLSLSLGIVCYNPESPCTVSELIARADEMMYLQKQNKKERI